MNFYHACMELVITLLVVGVVLLALETVLPGAITGIAGLVCLVAEWCRPMSSSVRASAITCCSA